MMNIKKSGSIAIMCAGLAHPGLAHALADCYVDGVANDGGQDCINLRTNRVLARGYAENGVLFLDNRPGTVQSGMFGYDSRGIDEGFIETCQIVLDGDGDDQTDFFDCPGLVYYDIYGNVDL